jgi:hypothetical protein
MWDDLSAPYDSLRLPRLPSQTHQLPLRSFPRIQSGRSNLRVSVSVDEFLGEKLDQISADDKLLHWLIVVFTFSLILPRENLQYLGEISSNVVSAAEVHIFQLPDRLHQVNFLNRCVFVLLIRSDPLPFPTLQPFLMFLRNFNFSDMVNVNPIISSWTDLFTIAFSVTAINPLFSEMFIL